MTEPSTTLDQDALLQASRRVDWRFLLPDPDLGETAYIGRADASLIDSLRQFSRSLTIIEPGQSAITKPSHFTLVVASNPSRSALCEAADLTRAGGFVYVEVDRRVSRQSSPRHSRDSQPRGVTGYLSCMQQLNLSEPQVHWHWPNFESCNEIIPLPDRAAGICTLRRRGSSSQARWKRRLARLLLETRLLSRFVPCFSVIAQRCS